MEREEGTKRKADQVSLVAVERSAPGIKRKFEDAIDEWPCEVCTLVNTRGATECDACGTRRREAVERKSEDAIERRNCRYPDQCTLMIGNPGVGKSTLLNALVGAPVFKSGISYGTGMTQVLQMYQATWGAWYGDTPGLADTEMRQKAANEICKALKTKKGYYQLIFVVTTEAGRIRPADVATIKLVLDALPKTRAPVPYGIIVNKVSERLIEKLKPDQGRLKQMLACLNVHSNNPTSHILLYPENKDLNDADDIVHIPTDMLDLFMQQVPFIEIKPEDVGKVCADEFEMLSSKFEHDMTRLKDDKAALEAKMAKDKDEMRRQYQDLEARHQADLKRAEDAALQREAAALQREAAAIETKAVVHTVYKQRKAAAGGRSGLLGGLGAAAGFLFGGPIGALAGLFAGSLFS
jgi:GTPase Era involved in 16S rRNA processing